MNYKRNDQVGMPSMNGVWNRVWRNSLHSHSVTPSWATIIEDKFSQCGLYAAIFS